MNIGQKIIDAIERWRDKKRKNLPGSLGQFWRDGGNELLFDLPVTTGGLIIDAGGYRGEWSAQMISRFGCRSLIFEPVPEFFEHCRNYFKNNKMVQVHKAALGRTNRKTTFSFFDDGTSEHREGSNVPHFEVEVIDVASVFDDVGTHIACLKLNIEGGEYDVLERLLETNKVVLCDSLLIQFHRQPAGYEVRYKKIIEELHKTHNQIWCYEMVWEKWVRKDIDS